MEIDIIMGIALAAILGLELKHERCLGRIEAKLSSLNQ